MPEKSLSAWAGRFRRALVGEPSQALGTLLFPAIWGFVFSLCHAALLAADNLQCWVSDVGLIDMHGQVRLPKGGEQSSEQL